MRAYGIQKFYSRRLAVSAFGLVVFSTNLALAEPNPKNMPTAVSECRQDFLAIGKSVAETTAKTIHVVPQTVSREVKELGETVDAIRALRRVSRGEFWSAKPIDRERFLREAAATNELSVKTRDEFKKLFYEIDTLDSESKSLFYRLLALPDDNAVAVLSRVLRQSRKPGTELKSLRNQINAEIGSRCVPVKRTCEASVLRDLFGSDRRPITNQDLAARLKPEASSNYQFVTSTRLKYEDAKNIADYLRSAISITIDADGVVIGNHPESRPLPAALRIYFDKLTTELRAVDPDMEIDKIEILKVQKGAARTPAAHFDGGPGIQILTTFQGERTWVQTADGRYVQVPELGDSLFFLTKSTDFPTRHLSPMDFESDRVMFRIQVESPRFARRP